MAKKEVFLKKLNLLYVEDDESIRIQLSSILGNFFNKIYVAENGIVGLELFKEKKCRIDLILSDINMPKMSGIEMAQEIRKINSKIPVVFATAYSDTEYLFEAIKLKVYDYVVKPIDIKATITRFNKLAETLYQEVLIEQQNEELKKYKELIDLNSVVIKTDLNQKITYVNERFCNITGYESSELLGKDFSVLGQNENDAIQISQMFKTVFKNKIWVGKIKSKAKSGSLYVVDCHTIATLNEEGDITGAISIQRDITQELAQIRAMKKILMKGKSDVILEGKETKQELTNTINGLQLYNKELENKLNNLYLERERIEYELQRLNAENNKLKGELSVSIKNAKASKEQTTTTFKMGKYNIDLKAEVKKLVEEKEGLSQRLLAIRMNLEPKIEELEKENREYLEKLRKTENIDVLNKKLEHWQNRIKDSFSRIECLENEILNLAKGDANILNRILDRQ